MFKSIRKRDGKVVSFKQEKIAEAIAKAGAATGEFGHDRAENIAEKVVRVAQEEIKTRIPTVEQIQDIVEKVLMESAFKRTAKAYIEYRAERNRVREAKTKLMQTYDTISQLDAEEDSDVKRGNAKRASVHTSTKAEAERIGRRISQNQGTEYVVHGLNGRIQRSDSHGNDPCPPRDK